MNYKLSLGDNLSAFPCFLCDLINYLCEIIFLCFPCSLCDLINYLCEIIFLISVLSV